MSSSLLAGLAARLWFGEQFTFSRAFGGPFELELELSHRFAVYRWSVGVDASKTEQEIYDQILAMLPRVRDVWRAQIKDPAILKMWEDSRI